MPSQKEQTPLNGAQQQPTSPDPDLKKRKLTLEKARAAHLSRQLQLRLQYARLKVDHGWQKQTLNEVENLYFRHSHMNLHARTSQLRPPATTTSTMTSATVTMTPGPAVPTQTHPVSFLHKRGAGAGGQGPDGQARLSEEENANTDTAEGVALQEPQSPHQNSNTTHSLTQATHNNSFFTTSPSLPPTQRHQPKPSPNKRQKRSPPMTSASLKRAHSSPNPLSFSKSVVARSSNPPSPLMIGTPLPQQPMDETPPSSLSTRAPFSRSKTQSSHPLRQAHAPTSPSKSSPSKSHSSTPPLPHGYSGSVSGLTYASFWSNHGNPSRVLGSPSLAKAGNAAGDEIMRDGTGLSGKE